MKLGIFKKILETFDIRSMKKQCNYKNCDKSVDKQIVIYQYDYKKGREDLATLFVCNFHVKEVNAVVKKIKKDVENIVIDKEIQSL
mgnify:CR=1 FL=1